MAWQTPKTNWAASDGVRDADFNRIEGNILELFKTGAGMTDITVYVSTSGNDTSGAGTSASPYRTITKALSVLPKNLNGKNVIIDIATGTYSESVVIKGYSNGTLVLSGAYGRTATIDSLEVNSSICEVRTISLRLSSGGITVTNGATLLCTGAVTVADAEHGLYVLNGSTCRMYSQLSVSNTTIAGIHAAGASRVYVLNISGSDNAAVVISEEGSVVAYGSTNISVNTLAFISRSGGRVLTGSGGLNG